MVPKFISLVAIGIFIVWGTLQIGIKLEYWGPFLCVLFGITMGIIGVAFKKK